MARRGRCTPGVARLPSLPDPAKGGRGRPVVAGGVGRTRRREVGGGGGRRSAAAFPPSRSGWRPSHPGSRSIVGEGGDGGCMQQRRPAIVGGALLPSQIWRHRGEGGG
uniref:Uncharacterized protein n=1 Tax=Oryza barthii TaxID=65489 RepID=A0A0D3GRP6_9ORYZ